MKKGLFLDRDGVINVDYGYVSTKEKFHFQDGIFDVVSIAKQLEYQVIIITNQSGIGRGYYSEENFNHLMTWVKDEFRHKNGGIDAIYFCPHHPIYGKGKYMVNCECRKPKPGMLIKAIKDLNIDPHKSILIGDKVTDTEAGKLAKIKTILQLNNSLDNGHSINIKQVSDIINYL